MPNTDVIYIMGGIIDGEQTRNVERYSDGRWQSGPSLPEVRSRFCAVALDQTTLAILGGEVENSPVSSEMKTYYIDRLEWLDQPDMLVRRKDHACSIVMLGETRGILVSGGVGEDEQLLDSVEFFSLDDQTWQELAPLKMPRTEHGKWPLIALTEMSLTFPFSPFFCAGMGVIAGLPTVIGGVSSNEFLASIEVLDNSSDESSPLGFEWRVAAHSMATPRYDFAWATAPISQVIGSQPMNKMDMCGMGSTPLSQPDDKVVFNS